MDEKGCRLTLHNQQQVLAQKGSKRVHMVAPEHAENVTVVGCGNALGNVIPPMVIYKGKRLKPEFVDNLPPRSEVAMSPKGSMTIEIFIKWLEYFSKFKTHGPVGLLLVFDGASSHLSIEIVEVAEKFDITLYCLPSNTTHKLQPMDKSVFRSFEHHWDQQLLRYWNQHPDRKLTKDRFGIVLSEVWKKCMTMENVLNGFRATGIYPFNSDILPDEAYAPSELTERPVVLTNEENIDVSSDEDDNVPLARIQARLALVPENINPPTLTPEIAAQSMSQTPLSVIMATPKVTHKLPRVPRRNAINYKAQALNRNLFCSAASAENGKKVKKSVSSKNKEKVPYDPTKPSTSTASFVRVEDSWLCPVREENREESMRMCSKCQTWYHEECVGLSEDDEDSYVCHECMD